MRVLLSKDSDTKGFDELTLSLGNGSMEPIAGTDLVEIPQDMYLKVEPNTPKNKDGEQKSMRKLSDQV